MYEINCGVSLMSVGISSFILEFGKFLMWTLIYVTDGETTKEAGKDGDMAGDEAEGDIVDPSQNKAVVLTATTESGHVLEIRVDQDRPKSFRVQYFHIYMFPGCLG
jgi:hypothetical protein